MRRIWALDRRAAGHRRACSGVPRSQDPGNIGWWHTLGQRHAGPVPGPGRHRHRADDVLRALARPRLRQHPVHRRDAVRGARARHPSLGRRPPGPAHRAAHPARVRVGLDKYPRELNWLVGARAALRGPRLRLHRLPAALGPEGVLGDRGRHEHRRAGAVHRRAAAGAAPRRPQLGARDPRPLLRHPRLGPAGRALHARRLPPLRGHPPGDRRVSRDGRRSPSPARGESRREAYEREYAAEKTPGKPFLEALYKDAIVAFGVCSSLVIVLAIVAGAPLEEPANPNSTDYVPAAGVVLPRPVPAAVVLRRLAGAAHHLRASSPSAPSIFLARSRSSTAARSAIRAAGRSPWAWPRLAWSAWWGSRSWACSNAPTGLRSVPPRAGMTRTGAARPRGLQHPGLRGLPHHRRRGRRCRRRAQPGGRQADGGRDPLAIAGPRNRQHAPS